jgi:hypothetical protein
VKYIVDTKRPATLEEGQRLAEAVNHFRLIALNHFYQSFSPGWIAGLPYKHPGQSDKCEIGFAKFEEAKRFCELLGWADFRGVPLEIREEQGEWTMR